MKREPDDEHVVARLHLQHTIRRSLMHLLHVQLMSTAMADVLHSS